MQFTEDECYELFLAVDNLVRQLAKASPELLALRKRLLPIYRERNKK
jgi:hypothetical protein